MKVSDYFRLSNGDVVFVGEIFPNAEGSFNDVDAMIYVNGEKFQTIQLIGEDRFAGGEADKRKGKRAVRTHDAIGEIPESANVRIEFLKS